MNPAPSSDNRLVYAVVVAILGLIIPAVLIVLLTSAGGTNTAWTAAEITSVAGLFTGIVGTLVGAFLGVQVGAAGKAQAEARAAAAEKQNLRAVALLDREQALEFLAH